MTALTVRCIARLPYVCGMSMYCKLHTAKLTRLRLSCVYIVTCTERGCLLHCIVNALSENLI